MGLLASVAPLECVWSQWKHIMIIIAFFQKPCRSVTNLRNGYHQQQYYQQRSWRRHTASYQVFAWETRLWNPEAPTGERSLRIPQWKRCFCLLTNRLQQVSLCMLASCFWLHERGGRSDSNMCVAVDVVDDRPENQVCTKGATGGVCWRDAVWPSSPGQHPWRQGEVAVNLTGFIVDEAHCVKTWWVSTLY